MKTKWSHIKNFLRNEKNDTMMAQQLVEQGESYLAKGDNSKALECVTASLMINNNNEKAYYIMTKALMPGDDYTTIISHFHETLEPESYVEIGVSKGNSLALVKKCTKAVVIDPCPNILNTIEAPYKLYPITSDEFFSSYDLLKELDTSRLNLAFIDGLHHFEQVLKDFINIERYSDKKTIVILHDCLPVTRISTVREYIPVFWCGDVWKIIPILKTYRPDLNINIVPTSPSGLGIVTNLDSSSTVLQGKYDQIVHEYFNQEIDYDFLDSDKIKTFDLIPNNWQQICQILSLPE